ncbi:unnamed protein product [Musa acuminata subsp. malaccensis]|uniref:(wild Malaysian banana) hypothetical protein n=1 Tax=Musa acuminata subsp. malaccensis TaxID=214687 RepID=A0A804ICT3_MUSAM|nr:PREDICTED: uncharacterized protein LOC103978368 [Musa acuminata subsp. malaccensis]XP_018678254.1 PREDICTED: uncharacterized protein LOC103978368 [Musa acuminata subsp. malaccensis]CAG1850379.1 unnamed protein product [Musa acuminata subsp. malaccensis]
MEVAVKELYVKGKEFAPVTDGKEDAEDCDHFTIRGYVAGVRKRDAKTCWPLFMPHNESSDIDANMLPPLHVSKFKRWSCLNCISTISTSADVTGPADLTSVLHEEIKTKSSSFLSNANSNRLCCDSKQSENRIHGERLLSDSSISISHGEHSPAPYCVKKANESTTECVAKEGIRVFTYGKHRSEENQDRSCKPASAVVEDENFEAGKTQARNIAVTEDNPETVLSADGFPMVCAKPNGGATSGVSDAVLAFRASKAYAIIDDEGITDEGEIDVVPDGMVKTSWKLAGVDLGIPKDDSLIATVANVTKYALMDLDQSNNEASYSNMDLFDHVNCISNQNSVLSSPHGKMNHKKVRKLRFLEDIMKSEELHTSKRACTFKRYSETCEIKSNHERGSGGLECEAQSGNCKSNLVGQNSEMTSTDPNKGIESNRNNDDDLCLLHWLKKVSKKLVTDDSQNKKAIGAKGYAEIKHRENKGGVSTSTHNAKDVDPLSKISRESKHNKSYTTEKENKVPLVKPSGCCLMQQENLVSNNATVKHVHPENDYPKMRDIISAPGKLDRSYDKKVDSRIRKKKASQVESKSSSQIKWSKKVVVKKQRTTKTHEKEILDDIPMDIVELLAKNQHERSLMNAEVASKNHHELSMMNDKMKHGNILNVSGYRGSKVMNAIYMSHASDTEFGIPTTPCGNQNADHGTEVCKSAKYQKHILIDLNQQATDALTNPEYDEYQLCTTHLHAVDSKKNRSLPNSYWGRMRMQDFGFYQKDRGVLAQSSSGGDHDILSAALNGRIHGVSASNIHAYCNYGKMVPGDSFLDRKQRTVVQKADFRESINTNGLHYQAEGGKSEQSTNRTTLPTRSYLVGGGNRCHLGRTAPIDLHTNETISALHLLRLVDQAALTGLSCDINHVGIPQGSNLNFSNKSTEVLGVEVGTKIRETPENPSTAGYSAHDQKEGNFSKPHRPIPRVGVLGSLLQKEIMIHSNKCIAPLGFNARCSGEAPSFLVEGMDKTGAPSSSINTEYGDGSNCLFGTTSAKQIVRAGDSSVRKFGMGQVGITKRNEAIQSVRHDCHTVNCVVNQNPADFSIPDEDNVYMRGSENLPSEYISPPDLHGIKPIMMGISGRW